MQSKVFGGLKRHSATLGMVAAAGAVIFVGLSCASKGNSDSYPYGLPENGKSLPLSLEWNLGQADAKYQIVGHALGYSLGLSANEASLELHAWVDGRAGGLTATLLGARKATSIEALDPLPGKANYFLGNDPKAWFTDVPTFRRAKFRNVYPGIDLVYYGQGATFEHDFIVNPGGDPSRIALSFGDRKTRLTADGDLAVETESGDVLWKKPVLYQENGQGRRAVDGRYRLAGNGQVGFEVGAYDVRRPLVIDPVILYGSYVGGNGSDVGLRVAVDAQGNSYFAGASWDANYLITSGARSSPTATAVTGDVVVTKLNADGSAIVFSTRLGGSSIDAGFGVAVDNSGSVYITGTTYSRNFPTTTGAYRPEPRNPSLNEIDQGDCFVTKLSTTGNRPEYSTYLGGTNQDACLAVAVDAQGAAYVTGVTMSNNYPVVGETFQGALRLGTKSTIRDAFITKINPDGAGLAFSTYFGGNGDDVGTAIAVDSARNVYITGFTDSRANFPLQGALQAQFKGGGNATNAMGDAFVAKINSTGEQLIYSTYLGGSLSDAGSSIAVDAQGNAYITGNTMSTDLPGASQGFQAQFAGSGTLADAFCATTVLCSSLAVVQAGDAFVAKLNPAGSALVYSTYIGGALDDRGYAIAVDSRGSAWITGTTQSANFPVSTDAAQRTYNGQPPTPGFHFGDAFVTQLDPAGKAIVYSSYIGGSGDDYGVGIAIDTVGNAYLSGGTTSINFPTTRGSARPGYGGHSDTLLPAGDAFLMKLGEAPKVEEPKPAISSLANLASGATGTVAPGMAVVITGTAMGPATAVSAPAGASLTTTLSDVRVLFGQTAAPLLSVSATSITAIAPFALAAGSTAQVTVEYKTNKSPAFAAPVADASPGLFTTTGIGRGQAAAANEDGAANSVDTPAVAGSILVLTGTGGGVTDPPSTDGAIAAEDGPALAQPVTVRFGDIAAEEVFYSSGMKGKPAGYFQITLRIPASVPAGEVPVVVTVGAAESQAGVTVAVKAPEAPPE